MYTNAEIIKALQLTATLGEMHNANPFKLKAISNAAFYIDKHDVDVSQLNEAELSAIPGIGKSIAQKITDLKINGSIPELDEWAKLTPIGVIEMLQIKGLGAKKVKSLWQELGIESPGELLYACKENRLVSLKGFGDKTQAQVLKVLEYNLSSKGKIHFAEAYLWAESIQNIFKKNQIVLEFSGELKRQLEVISSIEFVCNNGIENLTNLNEEQITLHENQGNWTGTLANQISFNILNRSKNTILQIGPQPHIEELMKLGANFDLESEAAIYQSVGLPFIAPPLRDFELDICKKLALNQPIHSRDLKGVLHNHSTYSDGADTLRTMSQFVKDNGYEYFGICDHSQAAFYANGLKPDAIVAQHTEIDQLNMELAPFKVFKGIECDILSNGDLDYSNDILKSFDFVVASVHSNLRMDEEKAMMRLIKAIENPFTTILGHPTSRLLLSRPGYPIDHKKIIDACAANGVIIELNAHPYRLDIDWRWIPYCMEKEVMISINPDAHEKNGILDMKWGVAAAQKGGLTKEFTFNTKTLSEIESYFLQRKP